jgi:hypothetical protein
VELSLYGNDYTSQGKWNTYAEPRIVEAFQSARYDENIALDRIAPSACESSPLII